MSKKQKMQKLKNPKVFVVSSDDFPVAVFRTAAAAADYCVALKRGHMLLTLGKDPRYYPSPFMSVRELVLYGDVI